MKKGLISWMMVAFVACILGMLGVHWKQTRDFKQNLSLAEMQSAHQATSQKLILVLEKYRASSGAFRRMSPAEIADAKSDLRTQLMRGLEGLEAADERAADDRALIDHVRNRFAELLVVSAKLEPMLYSKDVYQKAEIQGIHGDMLKTLERLSANSGERAKQVRESAFRSADRSTRLLLAGAAISVSFVLLILASFYWSHTRPARFLRTRVRQIRKGTPQTAEAPLPGPYGEVESVMRDLVTTLETHRRDRLHFVTAVTTDLRPPLQALRSATDLIASAGDRLADDRGLRTRATEAVRRSLFRLSAVLEGLNDLIDANAPSIRLDEKVIDVGDLVRRTARLAAGVGSPHEVNVIAPLTPAWASVDAERLERVIIYLLSKLMLLQPQGGKFLIELETPEPGTAGELEIAVYDSELASAKGPQATGPEQDILRHWATQNGFGMSLAEKIMRAHGGAVTASGVAGTRVVFRVRIPKERVAIGLVSAAVAEHRLGREENPPVTPGLSTPILGAERSEFSVST